MLEERETPKKHIRHHARGVPSETTCPRGELELKFFKPCNATHHEIHKFKYTENVFSINQN